jgi:beta-glucosidase
MTKDGVVVEPYQDRSNSVEARVEDLLGRLTLADKAGLMFATSSRWGRAAA